MEKERMTRKEVKSAAHGGKVVAVPYCYLQNFLNGVEPFAYNSGLYGWNWDAYRLGGVVVVTGYRNLCGDELPPELVERYERAASRILENREPEAIENLREQFAQEVAK